MILCHAQSEIDLWAYTRDWCQFSMKRVRQSLVAALTG